MAKTAEFVLQKTSVTGDNDVVLTPVAGYRTFANGFPSSAENSTFYYYIRHKAILEWELGEGYLDDGVLVRHAVIRSSNGNSKVIFSSGIKEVTTDIPSQYQDLLPNIQQLISDSIPEMPDVPATFDDLNDGTVNKAFTNTEKNKLQGIATGATANSGDADLLSRQNHTGSQAASTISDFGDATSAIIDAKKGTPSGIAPLDANSKINTSYLPYTHIDDTSDADKPISTATQAALDAKPSSLEVGSQKYVATRLRNFRSAMAKLRVGQSDVKCLTIGDSTEIGISATGAGYRPNETKYFANYLMQKTQSAHDDSVFGFSGSGLGSRILHDARVSGNATTSSASVLGGYTARLSNTNDFLTFTPETPCDTFRVFFWPNGGAGVSVQATGGTAFTATVGTTTGTGFGTTALRYVDVTAGSLAEGNSVTITRTSGTNVQYIEIAAIEARDSTKKQVIVTNAGHWGSKTAEWVVTGGSNRSSLDILNGMPVGYYAFVIIKAGINDCGASVPVATFKANMQTLITAALARGCDVVLETDNPAGTYAMQPYIDALQELAILNGLLFINHFEIWASYTNANAQGYMADTLHPNLNGFSDMAVFRARPFLQVMSSKPIDKASIGLPNVNNTADADKPVSTATQTALNGKVSSNVTGIAGATAVTNIVFITQSAYDALATKDATTAYYIV